jgi:protein-tyrosine phosphatase
MKILTVCLGNICRSPLAQGILEQKIQKYGLNWQVDSAGTSAWHAGEKPDPRSISIALRNGIDITGQRARPFDSPDFNRFDLILAMDRENLSTILYHTSDSEHISKVRLFMSFHPNPPDIEVPDPYYDGGFSRVYDMLDEAAEALIKFYSN